MDNQIYGSIEEQAEAEVAAEDRKGAVKDIKDLIRQRNKAQTIVDNLSREIEDYVQSTDQGNTTTS